jgi:GT2 family glycosyltransferase
VLAALKAQTLPAARWEALLVDNASAPPVESAAPAENFPADFRVVCEPQLGLTAARQRGFREAHGEFAVLVDDDNVLAPDYLANVLALFAAHPRIGALGGRSVPEFEHPPAPWAREFDGLIACRDLGAVPQISQGLRNATSGRNDYPPFAPIGAGMALRRAAWADWLDAQREQPGLVTDRRGGELTSGGDNDIVLCAMRAGWEVGYFPSLSLTHLIPASRLDAAYLARLNRGIQKSWMQVLTLHEANPWPPLTPVGAALRKAKAWFTCRAWAGPAERIRWQGACGHFEGRSVT